MIDQYVLQNCKKYLELTNNMSRKCHKTAPGPTAKITTEILRNALISGHNGLKLFQFMLLVGRNSDRTRFQHQISMEYKLAKVM